MSFFFFFEQKGTEAGGNAFPEVSGRPSAVFRDKFSRCFANAAAGPDARLSGLSRKNKGTHPGRFGQTAFVPTGRGAGGIRYERGADSAEDRAASSGQTVPQNSAYDGLFRLFRRLVGTISCRLRMSETGDRPRESSVFLPTDRAGRRSRSPRWWRVGFPGTKHSPPSDQVQAGGFRGGALFLPGAFCRQKSGRPCRRKLDMMYLYTTLF